MCISPPGSGVNHAVIVHVSQLCSSLGCVLESNQVLDSPRTINAVVNYYRPSIHRINPNHGPTEGRYNVSIFGVNFGGSQGLAAAYLHAVVNGKVTPLALPILYQNNSVIVVRMEPGAGTFLSVSISIAGQSSDPLVAAWSFDGPVIRQVIPTSRRDVSEFVLCPTDPSGPCVSNWLPADYADVLITGENFGSEAQFAAISDLSVFVGDAECKARNGNPSVYESNSR